MGIIKSVRFMRMWMWIVKNKDGISLRKTIDKFIVGWIFNFLSFRVLEWFLAVLVFFLMRVQVEVIFLTWWLGI